MNVETPETTTAIAPVDSAPRSVEKRPGRPKGARARIFATLADLTTADFAFLRAALQGLDKLPHLYQRYYPELSVSRSGDQRLPAYSVARDQLIDLHRRIVKRAAVSTDPQLQACAKTIQSALPASAVDVLAGNGEEAQLESDCPSQQPGGSGDKGVMTFDEWLTDGNAEFYSEDEWEARYSEYVDSAGSPDSDEGHPPCPAPRITGPAQEAQATDGSSVAGAVRALGYLQTVLCSDPQPKDRTATWICRALTDRFSEIGINTLEQLRAYISRQGRNWWRTIPRLGPLRAQAIETWFDTHGATLLPIDRSGRHWHSRPPLASAITPLRAPESAEGLLSYKPTGLAGVEKPISVVSRHGIAPLELLRVPPMIDGRNGTFRVAGQNTLGASTDYEAVCAWLRSYLVAGKNNTFRAYRREIERYYLWCVLVARVALSSATTAHANAYRSFLQNIPPEFVGNDRVTREDLAWRPFRGQLNARSQAYAIGVVGQFYASMVRAGYCSTQPFGLIRTGREAQQAMDTTRSLTDKDLEWLRQALHAQAETDREKADQDGAKFTRRLRVMLQLALQSGMRLDEMANASTRDLRPAVIDGEVSDSDWMLRVVGKGQRIRDIPVRRELYDLILAHQRDVYEVLSRNAENATRIDQVRQRPPLIGALRAPVGSHLREIVGETEMANDNLGLSSAGIYAMLKRFVRRSIERGMKQAQRELSIQIALRDNMAGARTEERLAAAGAAVRQAHEELATWQRRGQISTHWFRHTFATRLLRANRDDAGLKLAQQLLGHASIGTTAEYVKQDEADKIRGARRVEPVKF
jgi:site-specific recombinase XerD